MITLIVLLLVSWAALFFVLRSRVHVHFTVTDSPQPPRRAGKRQAGSRPPRSRPDADASGTSGLAANAVPLQRFAEIQSALMNLGATGKRASEITKQAIAEHPDASLDIQLSVALQKARGAA